MPANGALRPEEVSYPVDSVLLLCPMDPQNPVEFQAQATTDLEISIELLCVQIPAQQCKMARRVAFDYSQAFDLSSVVIPNQQEPMLPTYAVSQIVSTAQINHANEWRSADLGYAGEYFFDDCRESRAPERDGPCAVDDWVSFETVEMPHMYTVCSTDFMGGSINPMLTMSLWDQCDDTLRPLLCIPPNFYLCSEPQCLQSSREYYVRTRVDTRVPMALPNVQISVEKEPLLQGGAKCREALDVGGALNAFFSVPERCFMADARCLQRQWFFADAPSFDHAYVNSACSYTPKVWIVDLAVNPAGQWREPTTVQCSHDESTLTGFIASQGTGAVKLSADRTTFQVESFLGIATLVCVHGVDSERVSAYSGSRKGPEGRHWSRWRFCQRPEGRSGADGVSVKGQKGDAGGCEGSEG